MLVMDFNLSKFSGLQPIELQINNFFLGILLEFFYFSAAPNLRKKSEWLLPHFQHMFDASWNKPFQNNAQTMFILRLFVFV